jgi:hypothetical protein
MKANLLLFILFLVFKSALATGEWITQGGHSVSMGYTSAAVCDFWSINNNQAGMAYFDKSAAGIYYENRFLINELATQTAAFTYKSKYGMLGASVGYSGDAGYNTTTAGIAYAMKLGTRFAAGIQLDYIGTALGEEYGKRSNVTFDAGIIIKLTEELTFGVHTFNPVHVKLSEYNNERIPVILNAGFGYTFSDKLLLTAEAYKNSEFPMEFRSGAEYKLNKIAFARIGISTNPARITFGFGIQMKKLTLDLSSSIHTELGYSPQASLQFAF